MSTTIFKSLDDARKCKIASINTDGYTPSIIDNPANPPTHHTHYYSVDISTDMLITVLSSGTYSYVRHAVNDNGGYAGIRAGGKCVINGVRCQITVSITPVKDTDKPIKVKKIVG